MAERFTKRLAPNRDGSQEGTTTAIVFILRSTIFVPLAQVFEQRREAK
ncbi:MAG TPA: hypothetical protein VE135_07225 [Pyrinomonadaceae bacterium]|nr:hypothetical protein [Pyrinomonadaceae bacterium]